MVKPPQFTLYPDDEDEGADQLEVTSQRRFVGPYCIPNSMADEPCEELGVEYLLDQLNHIMGTSVPLSRPLQSHLEFCISENYDFGMAYSFFHTHWDSLSTLAATRKAAEDNDKKMRFWALDRSGKYITNTDIPPRRIWDLCSNRVIPFWWANKVPWPTVIPVSHSWVDKTELEYTETLINQGEWRVPIPPDSSLERVRIELLNSVDKNGRMYEKWIDKRYAWLDVLCLRQKEPRGNLRDEQLEETRLEEWKIDVPTLGKVYRNSDVSGHMLIYFNGLGRPFRNTGFDNEHHWFKRAWTLQEFIPVSKMRLGGATDSSPSLSNPSSRPEFREFYKHLKEADLIDSSQGSKKIKPPLSRAINLMRARLASFERDRLACLISVTRPDVLPIYHVNQNEEDVEAAWVDYLSMMNAETRAHLFFWYPGHRSERHRLRAPSWLPSWKQLMATDLISPAIGQLFSKIQYDEDNEQYYGNLRFVDNCRIAGFGPTRFSPLPRRGVVQIAPRYRYQPPEEYVAVANHRVVIDEDAWYMLLFTSWRTHVVVGQRDPVGCVRKVCTLEVDREFVDKVESDQYGGADVLALI